MLSDKCEKTIAALWSVLNISDFYIPLATISKIWGTDMMAREVRIVL